MIHVPVDKRVLQRLENLQKETALYVNMLTIPLSSFQVVYRVSRLCLTTAVVRK